MATVSESALASAFLKELGAPDTPIMQKAVVAWLRGESGHTIIGNNPWNLRPAAAAESGIKTCGSRTSVSSGQFAVFCSPTDGARAAARLLIHGGNDYRGYGRVVKAARAGKPVDFLNALARSAWDAGRYGTKNGGPNKLLAVFASIVGLTVDQVNSIDQFTSGGASSSGAPGGGSTSNNPTGSLPTNVLGTQTGGILGAWANAVSFPVGHVLTAADVQLIMATLASHGYFANDPGGVGQSITAAILNSKIGQPWTPDLLRSIQSALFSSADQAVPKTPLDPLFGIAGSVGQVIAAIFDPYKWLMVLTLLAGVALTAWGGINIARAAA